MTNRTPQDNNGAGDFDAPCEQRTPGRDVLGKLDDRLPEIRVPFEIRQLAERAAHDDGLDLSTWMRELFYARLLTPDHLAMLYRQRAERVLGNAVQNRTMALHVVDPMRRDVGQ